MPFFIEIISPDSGAKSSDEVIISYIKEAKSDKKAIKSGENEVKTGENEVKTGEKESKSGGKEAKISNIGAK